MSEAERKRLEILYRVLKKQLEDLRELLGQS